MKSIPLVPFLLCGAYSWSPEASSTPRLSRRDALASVLTTGAAAMSAAAVLVSPQYAWAEEGNFEKAEAILRRVVKSTDVEEDVVTFSSVIKALANLQGRTGGRELTSIWMPWKDSTRVESPSLSHLE